MYTYTWCTLYIYIVVCVYRCCTGLEPYVKCRRLLDDKNSRSRTRWSRMPPKIVFSSVCVCFVHQTCRKVANKLPLSSKPIMEYKLFIIAVYYLLICRRTSDWANCNLSIIWIVYRGRESRSFLINLIFNVFFYFSHVWCRTQTFDN